MLINENIAKPYCYWTVDAHAKNSRAFIIRNALYIISGCALILQLILFIDINDSDPIWVVSPFVICLITAILGKLQNDKISTSSVKCSKCKQNMKHVQHNYPGDPCKGIVSLNKLTRGTNGRLYAEYHGEKGQSWYQVMQELMICQQCQRYIILNEAKLVEIGKTWLDVKRREERLDNARKSITKRTYKIKKK